MAVYIVMWNINREKPNYAAARTAFLKGVDAYQNMQDSGLETVRFISTTENADTVEGKLRKNLDNNDRLLVSKMNRGEHQGWLDRATWDWINARL
jgi:hypothetical protein